MSQFENLLLFNVKVNILDQVSVVRLRLTDTIFSLFDFSLELVLFPALSNRLIVVFLLYVFDFVLPLLNLFHCVFDCQVLDCNHLGWVLDHGPNVELSVTKLADFACFYSLTIIVSLKLAGLFHTTLAIGDSAKVAVWVLEIASFLPSVATSVTFLGNVILLGTFWLSHEKDWLLIVEIEFTGTD